MKNFLKLLFVVAIIAGITNASAIKVWASGDVLSFSDLNANFAHIHSLMVGGHGARLYDADVNASAAIAHTKLATPGVLAKSTFIIGSSTTPCAAGTCTLTGASGITPTVTWNSLGNYTVVLPVARTDAFWSVQLTPMYCNASTGGCYCSIQTSTSTTTTTVQCFTVATAGPAVVAANIVVAVAIFDNNN